MSEIDFRMIEIEKSVINESAYMALRNLSSIMAANSALRDMHETRLSRKDQRRLRIARKLVGQLSIDSWKYFETEEKS